MATKKKILKTASTKKVSTSKTTTAAGKKNTVFATLAYLGGAVTGIIFLLLEKKDRFVRFHAAQSIILFGALWILPYIVGYIPVLGNLLNMLLGIFGIIIWIVMMVKAYNGVYLKLPYIGDLAENLLEKIR